jgi:hypothetical protein
MADQVNVETSPIKSNPIQASPIESNSTKTKESNPRPPPTYNTSNLLSQLKKAKDESKHPAHFVGNSFAIFCGSALATFTLGLSLALPIVI